MGHIQTPEFGLRLSKLFQMAGETQALREVEEVVFPVVVVADISKEGVRSDLFAGAVTQPLNAANASKIAFVNVAGSGVNFLPRSLRVRANNAGCEFTVQIEPSAGYVPLTGGVSVRDCTTLSPLCFVGSNPAGVGVLPGVFIAQNSSGLTTDIDTDGVILPPGKALVVYSSIINITIDLAVLWKMDALN